MGDPHPRGAPHYQMGFFVGHKHHIQIEVFGVMPLLGSHQRGRLNREGVDKRSVIFANVGERILDELVEG